MAPTPPLVALRNASVTFGGPPVFENVELGIGRGDKVCLVGRNGSGKSTLMKVLAGQIAVDAGERFLQPGIRVSYLPQEPAFDGFATVHDYVAAGLPPGDLDETHRVDAVLDRLGVAGDRNPTTLSGGEGRRAALARTLVSDPDVLLLDEPTNHLDLPTIEWLEGELESRKCALVLISHDRRFLSHLSRSTAWLDRGQIRQIDRGFSAFEAWQQEVFIAEDVAAHKLDRKIASEMHWLREGISARRTRNMGRVRALQQLRHDRAEQIRGDRQVKLAIAEGETSGRLVIEAEHISKSFDSPEGPMIVCRDFSTRILRGDRVGLIGPNGAGKTTLLRILTGQTPPDSGTVRLGVNLQPVYYDQKRTALDPEATIHQVLCPFGGDAVVVRSTSRHVASYMRDFLFDPRLKDTPTKALSGGERNRLLLATLFAKPSNLMILDEPTNDLDMDTLDLLEEVLSDYEGTLLLVSHDRDFLDRLVGSVIAVEGDGDIQEYVGGYSDYAVQRPARPAAEAPRPKKPDFPAAEPKRRRKLPYQQQRELEQLPQRIDGLTADIKRLETVLADPNHYARDPASFQKTTEQLSSTQAELEKAEERWLELEALREELEAQP
jgi:ATP-binding cassette subfamily F protein uup